MRTGKLTYYQSNKDTKEGVEIPLHETMAVKGGLGKTKGTEHRITVQTCAARQRSPAQKSAGPIAKQVP
mgnify:CR=1 FL=1